MSPALVFWLLALMAIGALFQHSTVQLFVSHFPGNKFYNGILFGFSEIIAMVVSNVLLLYFHDITAFRCVFTAGIISLLMLVFSDILG